MSPYQAITTCDICGAPAEFYESAWSLEGKRSRPLFTRIILCDEHAERWGRTFAEWATREFKEQAA